MTARKMRGNWWVDFRDNGVRYRKRSPVNSKTGATELETVLRLRLAKGEAIAEPPIGSVPADAPRDETFTEFAVRWLTTYVATNNKPSERRTKETVLRVHLLPAFGALPLSTVGPERIESYKATKLESGLCAKTVNNHLTILKKLLRTAEEWGALHRAPLIRLLRVAPKEVDYLSSEESALLLSDATEPRWQGMVLVALHTGLRLGELLALEYSDVDPTSQVLRVSRSIVRGIVDSPKSNRIRRIPMTRAVTQFFATGPRFGLVFPRRDGRAHVNDSTAENAIKRMCRRVGLRLIGWHTLRHTFATNLAVSGIPLHVAQRLLGHSSIATTMRYLHTAPADLRHAMATFEQAAPQATDRSVGTVGHALRSTDPKSSHLTVQRVPDSFVNEAKTAA